MPFEMEQPQKYVFHVWLLAQFLHPVLYGLINFLFVGEVPGSLFPFAALFGFVLSLPVLFFCQILIPFVLRFPLSDMIRELIWVCSILSCLLLVAFLFGRWMGFLLFIAGRWIVPAVLSAVIALLAERSRFRSLIKMNKKHARV